MGTITMGDFAAAAKPLINVWWGDYANRALLYPQYMEVEKSTDAYEEDALMPGFGLATIKPQGSALAYDDTRQGHIFRYEQIMYAKGYVVSRELIEDAMAPVKMEQFTKRLRTSMENTVETVCANLLNNGFDSNFTFGDGKELFAANHPTLGADLRNELAVAADLSEAALENAITDLRNMKDHRGLRVPITAKKLIVPNEEAFNAERILNSVLRVGVADNDPNAIRNTGVIPEGYLVNTFLTDTDAWFLTTSADDGLKYIERTSLRIEDDNEFDTFNMKVAASTRFAVGVTDVRGAFASEGAA